MDDGLGLPQGAFTKIDTEEDEAFYEPPRLVHHIDDGAIAALTQFYRGVLPAGGIWRALDDEGHARLVELYLRHAGFERVETHRLAEWVEDVSDPLFAVVGRTPAV